MDPRERCRQAWASCCAWKRRWLPAVMMAALAALYVVLLVFYGSKASATLKVSRMTKAEHCVIDHVGHKSGSKKVTTCCKERLGTLCKYMDYMPCPSISVQYKLLTEPYTRAGYINYWNPRTLLFRYASNLHCMIVPITCPEPEDEWLYTMEHIESRYNMSQQLDCYVYPDIPERPLLITADTLPHPILAVLVLAFPPVTMLVVFIVCFAARHKQLSDDSCSYESGEQQQEEGEETGVD